MTRSDKVAYLADLVTLIDFHESLGSKSNKWVQAEFNALNQELITELKEEHDEARQSAGDELQSEEGADPAQGIRRRS